MLVNLKEILEIAEEKKIAVGAFNTPNFEALQAILWAAAAENQPVIIQMAQSHESLMALTDIGPVMVEAAKKAPVPVCVHLDHGETLEYLETALKIGFTGIMYDGSTLPYEENAANTRKAVEMAHQYGAGVEAELGSMGRREMGGPNSHAGEDETKIYTDPDQASLFVNETGIDALACSFGTTHGIYLTKPKLDFDVVRNVRAKAGQIPVVMHGGSGVSREDFHNAVDAGVRKINYFTYMDKAAGSAAWSRVESIPAGSPIFFTEMSVAARAAMQENVASAIRVFAKID